MGEALLVSAEILSQLTVVVAIETSLALAKLKLNRLLTKRTTFACLTSNSIAIQAPPIHSTCLCKVGRFVSEGIRPMEAIALTAVAAKAMLVKLPAIP